MRRRVCDFTKARTAVFGLGTSSLGARQRRGHHGTDGRISRLVKWTRRWRLKRRRVGAPIALRRECTTAGLSRGSSALGARRRRRRPGLCVRQHSASGNSLPTGILCSGARMLPQQPSWGAAPVLAYRVPEQCLLTVMADTSSTETGSGATHTLQAVSSRGAGAHILGNAAGLQSTGNRVCAVAAVPKPGHSGGTSSDALHQWRRMFGRGCVAKV